MVILNLQDYYGDTYMGMYHPYGLLTPVSWVAMFAPQRYIHEYGIKDGGLGRYSLSQSRTCKSKP